MGTCPTCGKRIEGEFSFCPFCGASIFEVIPSASREERKVVSVVFCDLVDFTAASESADPEDVRARLRPYSDRVRAELERFGATVEKFIGDAVMAVFGAPIVHEDDAERAVRASLQILEAIADLNAADPALSLQVRIGVNTGEAVVDLDARPELGQGIATGDVVNTASRLQAAAPVDGIAVAVTTYRHTERVFDYELIGSVQVKGKTEPLEVWRPLRPRARLGTDVTRAHSTPLVGRDWEKSLLTGTFERVAQQRTSALVTLVGEPGMGKSRMSAELLGYVENRPGLVRWRQGRCLPYGEKIAFWALGEIVKAECGILESDSAIEAEAKLKRALPADDADRAWLLARLAPLAGLPGDAAGQEESFAAWRHLLELLADQRETVLTFEDLHWADDALVSFLEYLCDRTRDVPLLVLCTARPEFYDQHPTFGVNARNAQRIDLGPLSWSDSEQLVASLLGHTTLSDDARTTLLERVGGNPLYAGEFVRLLDDQSRFRQHAGQLPDSVHAVIAARLDTLSADHKSLLQDASVVGKVFWAGALAEMSGRERQSVTQALRELTRKELIHPARASSMRNEQEFAFSHLLVRDVCYAQIARAGRATRHRAAARWLEGQAAERAEDLADVLAYHYLAALDFAEAAGRAETDELRENGIRYLSLSAERAMGLNVSQAESSMRRALVIATDDHPQRAQLLERWALTLLALDRNLEAKSALDDALERYETQGDFRGAGRALTTLSTVAWFLGDPVHDQAMHAVTLLTEHPGRELVAAYTEVAATCFVGSAHEAAVEAAQRALHLAEELGLPEPERALGFLGAARCFASDERGMADLHRALALAIERSQSRNASVVYANMAKAVSIFEGPRAACEVIADGVAFCTARGLSATSMYVRGGGLSWRAACGLIDETLTEAAALAAEAEAIGDLPSMFAAHTSLARLRAQRGDGSTLAEDAEQVLAIATRADRTLRLACLGGVALTFVAAGRPEHAKPLLTELAGASLARAEPTYPEILPELVRCAVTMGDVELARQLADGVRPVSPWRKYAMVTVGACLAEADGHVAEAVAGYADAARCWREFGNVPELGYALLGRGRCLRLLDDPDAKAVLTEALELFSALGFQPALAEVRALLSREPAADW